MRSLKNVLAVWLALITTLATVPASAQGESLAAASDSDRTGDLLKIAKDLDPGRDQSDALVGESFRAWRNRGRMKQALSKKRREGVRGRELAKDYLAFVTTHPGASETPAYLDKAVRLFMREGDSASVAFLSYIQRVSIEAVKESREESGKDPDPLVRSTSQLVDEHLRALRLRESNDRLRERNDVLVVENRKLDEKLGRLEKENEELMTPLLKQLKLDKKSCEEGKTKACHDVARIYAMGVGRIDKDFVRAREFYDRACGGGHIKSCLVLGESLLLGGLGLDKDENRARLYFEQACPEEGDKIAKACNVVAVSLLREGPLGDLERGLELLEESCGLGFAIACNSRAFHFINGTNGDVRRGQANAFFEKSCGLRNSKGCVERAKNAKNGVDGPEDRELAVRYYDRACKLGDRDACPPSHASLSRAFPFSGSGRVPLPSTRLEPNKPQPCMFPPSQAFSYKAFALSMFFGFPLPKPKLIPRLVQPCMFPPSHAFSYSSFARFISLGTPSPRS